MAKILMLIAMGIFYFLPTIRAHSVKHRQTNPIMIINLLLGWTIIGWIVALAWSFTTQDRKEVKNA